MTASTATSTERAPDNFDHLAEAVRQRAAGFNGKPLFTTDAGDLFKVFLDGFSEDQRQHHNCHACKSFLERFGGLVSIGDAGETEPIFWNRIALQESEYAQAVLGLNFAVRRAPITGVFLAKEAAWGIAQAGGWSHFSVPALSRFSHALKTAGQMMAEKREDYGMLQRGLAEFPRELVAKACALLDTDTLYRSEKVSGVAKWMLELHERRDATKNDRVRDNLTWLAVATAPAGFCHVRTTMISTLLEDLKAGIAVDHASRKFAEKMHPLQYLRPQAPPSDGNIEQAEKVIATLQASGSLERRFARLSEIKTIWTPRIAQMEKPAVDGVFSHLRESEKKSSPLEVTTPIAITWEKFARDILPNAETVDCLIPTGRAPFVALVTAANPDAPPILQWDFADARNPVSWYVYNGGSYPADWNLRAGEACQVKAVALSPAHWHPDRPYTNHGNAVVAILEGAKDLRSDSAGAGLFPEILKSDYHAIRRTIEAFSRSAKISGRDEGDANGIILSSSRGMGDITFRVSSKGIRALYRPDRWD